MIPFIKMQGIGNDYVYLDAFAHPDLARRDDLPAIAVAMSDRRFGVGSDGLIVVAPPGDRNADARMIMFNADGSEGAMCGNGIRCVVKLVAERGYDIADSHPAEARASRPNSAAHDRTLTIATASGLRTASAHFRDGALESVSVDMAEPVLQLDNIPALRDRLDHAGRERDADLWRIAGRVGALVSMGNPHFISFVDYLPSPGEVDSVGPIIEHHPAFPKRINVHFVTVQAPDAATMITWERGSGRTHACGTGASAVLVAGVLTGRIAREATLRLPGGELRIAWNPETNRVTMTGPATEVFRGQWPE